MILRELFEAKAKSVGIIFGRFNPPHMGHMKAWEMASENSTWYVGTNKSTQGPKDPLPFDIKIKAMEAVYPEIKGHIVAEQSWLTLASKVYEKHGNIVLNVYTDEDWVTKALVQYNGKEGAHGYYEFGTIQQQATPRLSSATALRAAVAADDRDLFGQAAGVDPNTLVAGHPFFDVVRHYLMPHAEKAATKVVKKKVKEPVAELSSELLGRYKKAAGADAKKADADGDYARGNKRFSGIVKATNKQFDNDAKGVEEGEGNFAGDTTVNIGGETVRRLDVGDMVTYFGRKAKIEDQSKNRRYSRITILSDFGGITKDVLTSDLKRVHQGVAEGQDDKAEAYRAHLIKTMPQMMNFLSKKVKGWTPGKEEMLGAIDTAYMVMKHTGDVKQAGKALMDELNTLHRMSQGKQGVAENAWDRLQREKALESAGVGIITKQNSTVDVNKNTPKKNLKAFRLI